MSWVLASAVMYTVILVVASVMAMGVMAVRFLTALWRRVLHHEPLHCLDILADALAPQQESAPPPVMRTTHPRGMPYGTRGWVMPSMIQRGRTGQLWLCDVAAVATRPLRSEMVCIARDQAGHFVVTTPATTPWCPGELAGGYVLVVQESPA
jgi:hypothetical protein